MESLWCSVEIEGSKHIVEDTNVSAAEVGMTDLLEYMTEDMKIRRDLAEAFCSTYIAQVEEANKKLKVPQLRVMDDGEGGIGVFGYWTISGMVEAVHSVIDSNPDLEPMRRYLGGVVSHVMVRGMASRREEMNLSVRVFHAYALQQRGRSLLDGD